MLFNFELKKLDDVARWGDNSLHWFGLSDGFFWIDTGSDKILEYSPGSISKFELQCLETTDIQSAFVDYQVVRLWEDILEMLSSILNPLPLELHFIAKMNSEETQLWMDRVYDRLEQYYSNCSEDEIMSYYLLATSVLNGTELNFGYLVNGPFVGIVNIDNKIIVSWSTSKQTEPKAPTWTATSGRLTLSKNEFLSEVQDFDQRFMALMRDRCEEAEAYCDKMGIKLLTKNNLTADQTEREKHFSICVHREDERNLTGAINILRNIDFAI